MCVEKNTFIRVEYDADFHGSDYTGVGDFLFIDTNFSDNYDSVEAAFTAQCGLPHHCIVHYTVDELYSKDGHQIMDFL